MCLPPGHPEHAQEVLGHPIGGLLDVAVGLVLEELTECEQRPCCHRDRDVEVRHVEAAGLHGGGDVASGPS